ncbi:MAG TPA: TIGR00282 family metallophosphoesterase [Symbiobacteriaceae bacterium]|nr:TIGR00282 family metallophosphoesterase [Symbiobacteriaceae bacterium]
MRILFFGDVVGRPGRDVLRARMNPLRESLRADVVVVNGENAAGGAGITAQICREWFDAGVDAITLGNHAWDKREIATYIDEEPRLIRPINFPPGTPGYGSYVVKRNGQPVAAIVQAHGRVFSPLLLGDPFRGLEEVVQQLRQVTPVIIVDMHGEATSEKVAMGWFLDGKVSAVVGTHTHVQTADEVILPGGTAYLTDVGMCGPWVSVIGTNVELVLERFLTQMPVRLEVAAGPAILSAVVIDIDSATGRATAIERILERTLEK